MNFYREVFALMNREDLLNFNFDWRDEDNFRQTLKDSNLSVKEKQMLTAFLMQE